LNVPRCSLTPGWASAVAATVRVSVTPPVAASMAEASASPPTEPSPTTTNACTTSSDTAASGRLARCTSRHVSSDPHIVPWPLYCSSGTKPATVTSARLGPSSTTDPCSTPWASSVASA